jgi:hypothetical protein
LVDSDKENETRIMYYDLISHSFWLAETTKSQSCQIEEAERPVNSDRSFFI